MLGVEFGDESRGHVEMLTLVLHLLLDSSFAFGLCCVSHALLSLPTRLLVQILSALVNLLQIGNFPQQSAVDTDLHSEASDPKNVAHRVEHLSPFDVATKFTVIFLLATLFPTQMASSFLHKEHGLLHALEKD